MIWNNTGLIGLRMDAMHEDNNLLFSTSDVAKILAFSKMVEQALGKKIEHENDTPEKSNLRNTDKARKGKPMPEVGLTIPQRPKCKSRHTWKQHVENKK